MDELSENMSEELGWYATFVQAIQAVYRDQLPWLLNVLCALFIDILAVLLLVLGAIAIDKCVHLSDWSDETMKAWEKTHFCLMVGLTALLSVLCAFDIIYAKVLHVKNKP